MPHSLHFGLVDCDSGFPGDDASFVVQFQLHGCACSDVALPFQHDGRRASVHADLKRQTLPLRHQPPLGRRTHSSSTVDDKQITATIQPADIPAPGQIQVWVVNSAGGPDVCGGGPSQKLAFTVD